jgi:RecA-family ATPase
MIDLQAVARALGGKVSGGQVLAPGPGHTPADRSLSVKLDSNAPDGFVVHSFSTDDPIVCRDYVRQKIGLRAFKPNGRPNGHGHASTAPQAKVKTRNWIYKNEDGTPHLGVRRIDQPNGQKSYSQYHWNGSGFEKGKPAGAKIPYRLQELANAPGQPVFICEGEKCADAVAALGWLATTASEGAGKWTADLNKWFADRAVYILQDNDEPGLRHANLVASSLLGVAREVRVIKLEGLGDGEDVFDWIARAPFPENLLRIAEDAPLWEEQTTLAGPADEIPEQTRPRLQWLDMSRWDYEPVPERKWAIKDRVPLRQPGLFSGEGGTGKSIIELMKNVAHVTGKDWLGSLPEIGPAFYLGAEDDVDELHIRLAAIAAHYRTTFTELINGGLRILPLLGKDAVLCAASHGGKVEPTALYWQIYEAAADIKPKNISIDTLSRAFAGNEIDRVQVYAFACHLQALAMVAGGSVTVLSHPSLTGIASGSGISGSTAWHGAFRFRQYLKGIKPDASEQPDDDVRELEFKKNQYGPKGESVVVRYQRGLFLPVVGTSNLERAAAEQRADQTFLELLDRFTDQGRNTCEKPSANNYAPALFAKEKEARECAIRKADFEAAMRRLFATNRIRVEPYGPPSRISTRLVRREVQSA